MGRMLVQENQYFLKSTNFIFVFIEFCSIVFYCHYVFLLSAKSESGLFKITLDSSDCQLFTHRIP